ncbi:MAG TPA: hypothetical protein VM095_18125, partial [Pyrinomonadaceae bacterium]|nr:hypothetical protein [Pyrinomonadaceae bacterium]
MSSLKVNSLRLVRFPAILGIVFILSTFITVRHAQMNHTSRDTSRQFQLTAQEGKRTSSTQINETGADQSDIRVRYNDGDHSLEIRAKGGLEFTDDDSDVKSMTRDGYLMIEERRGSMSRRLEISPGANNQPQRTFFVGGQAHAFDGEGRAWL